MNGRKGKDKSRMICPNTGRPHAFTSRKRTNDEPWVRICSYCTVPAPGQARAK